jgi:hypothetical protein
VAATTASAADHHFLWVLGMRMVIGDPFDQALWRAAELTRRGGLEAVICF